MAEELNNSLEFTPTWIVAVVCSIIVLASLLAERGLHRLGKSLEHKKQHALFEALQKLKEELMLLGFISLLLTVTQNIISHFCIPPELATHMLPCKRPSESSEGSEHHLIYFDTIINRRRLLAEGSNSEHCARKGKVPLLSLEALHHLHIFIFVLAVVHVVFCVTTMLLGGARIGQWKQWENNIRSRDRQGALHHHEFFEQHAGGYWRRAAVVGWMIAFLKQFYGSVTESDYVAMRQGFIKEHCPRNPGFDFHTYMMRTLEFDFKKVVGISWYLWLFVVLFLLLNLDGWHTYFWLAFLPLILLLLVGAKLEHIIARLAQESRQKSAEAEQVVGTMRGRKEQEATRVKPSDEYFWFNRPSLVLNLIHFILFQNSFEIAFFFWIWCTYGFDSCIMEKIAFIIPRLIMGVIVQVLCSYSTLPLYTIVTQMGSRFKKGMFEDHVESSLMNWVEATKSDLAAVAGEAIKGWLPRRADSFEKLDKIGQGTYSNVYRARDLEQNKVVALKKVRFDNLEPESVRFMAREIHILRRLDHLNVIKLEGLVTSRMSCSLYLVFEYMEHDLAGLASHPGLKFTEAQVKCYMQQLLRGLDHCHSRGVLHRDIKGSNLLIDNNGILKIADFGLASFFDPNQTQPLTSRVVTLWYRPPELLLGATCYGTSVDLWSTGCILAELYAGKPIMPGRTEVEQLHKIFKLCGSPSEDYWRKSKLPHATIFKPQQPYRRCIAETFKDFPTPALALMEILLSIDPADRGTAASALKSEFFTTKPPPCDPSSLPKYPPSKEFDAKVRDEEARRQGAAGSKGQRHDPERRGARESRAVPAPDANAELVLSMQKRQGQPNSKSRSEKFNPHPEEVASGFPIDPPRPSQAVEGGVESQLQQHKRTSHSGPLSQRTAWVKAGKNQDDAPKISMGGDLSTLSGLVAARRSMLSDDRRERSGSSQFEAPKLISRFPGSFKEASESLMQQDQKNHTQGAIGPPQKEEGRGGNKDPILVGYGSKGHKIHYSGPLLVPSSNMDQMLKDHDRQIQEAVRRARLDKAKMRRLQAEGNQITTNSLFVSGR